MWLGLKAKPGTVCSSPSACDGMLVHHLPGETSASNDDIESDFVNGGWISTDMTVNTDSDTKMCMLMNPAYEIYSEDCSNSKTFYCKIPCAGKY